MSELEKIKAVLEKLIVLVDNLPTSYNSNDFKELLEELKQVQTSAK